MKKYTYDNFGRVSSMKYYNSDSDTVKESYTYIYSRFYLIRIFHESRAKNNRYDDKTYLLRGDDLWNIFNDEIF